MLCVLVVFELISIVIFSILYMSSAFHKIIPDYIYRDKYGCTETKLTGLTLMAFAGGWLFALYFIYLAYKYYQLINHKE